MALLKSIVTDHGITLPESYIRIDFQSGDKEEVNLRVRFYADAEKCQQGLSPVGEKLHSFTPNVSEGSQNIFKQGYEYLKTLPEYVDALDC